MMRSGSIIGICLVMLFVVSAMMGCTTKGIDFESGLREFEALKYDAAILAFEEIAQTENKYTNRARFYIGECYKFQGKWEEATAELQTVVDAEPSSSYLGAEARNRIAQIREGKRDTERLNILISNFPEQAPDAMLELGSVYDNKLGDYAAAIKSYEDLVERFPKTPKAAQAHFNMGALYFYKLYDLEKGWDAFRHINVENYPDLKYRVSEVETLLRDTNKTRQEIIEHQAFIKESQKKKIPEHGKVSGYEIYGAKREMVAQSFLAIGKKWRQLKNYPKSIEAYRMLIDRLPLMLRQAAQARYAIAEIYQLDLGRYYEAVDGYEEYIKKHPTDFRPDESD